VFAAGLARAGAPGEQTIVPLTPTQEQRVEPIGKSDDLARVEPVQNVNAQGVEAIDPPGPLSKAASTVGVALLTVTSAVVSVGIMAASLLLI
jgi:hypothetical protein